MNSRRCLTTVLAAGEGTRMKSALPKVLHKIAGRSMLGHVMASARATGSEKISVVVGPDHEAVEAEARLSHTEVAVFRQLERKGTAHAVLSAREALAEGYDDLLILFGDTPLVRPETLQRLRAALADGACVAVLGFDAADPKGYGRLLVEKGALVAIREQKDASAEEQAVTFCNGGIMGIAGADALALLEAVDCNNAAGEYYLTDIVALARQKGLKAVALEADEAELQGVNTREQLANAEAEIQRRLRTALMVEGVTFHDPSSVYLSFDTRIGRDCIVEPHVVFGMGVTVEDGAVIHAFSHLEGCLVGRQVSVGPFARLRPGTSIGRKARIGNFVEVKNSTLGEGAKINHLSYIGDAEIGHQTNIGAGTITCNYDGTRKFKTQIGAGAFIGSNSALVAPVTIGDGAYVGSGSVITEDVPAGTLGLGRARQVVKKDWKPVKE